MYDIIKNVIELQPFALKKSKPQVYVDNLGDNAVNINVRIWAPVSEWFANKLQSKSDESGWGNLLLSSSKIEG